jgi:hypothetical protein
MSTATKTKKKHIQELREQATSQEAKIMNLLQWDYERYCLFKYKAGLAFLDDYCEDDEELYKLLESSRTWWGWWKNHWLSRDASFVNPELVSHLSKIHVAYRVSTYRELHNVRELLEVLKVPDVIIDAACYQNEKSVNPITQRVVFGNH